jgi:hypothetical protein
VGFRFGEYIFDLLPRTAVGTTADREGSVEDCK